MKAIPHNRTYFAYSWFLVTLCDECAGRKVAGYTPVGYTLRPCEDCGRAPSQVVAAGDAA